MTDRELMQMALDALEDEAAIYIDNDPEDGPPDAMFEAIKTLRERLSQPEPEPVAYVSGYHGGNCVVIPTNPAVVFSVGTAFSYTAPPKRERLSQPEEVPCKTHPDAPHGFDRNASHSADRYVCECESWEPPPEPEPVAWGNKKGEFKTHEDADENFKSTAIPFYTAPPKREWVGLTDEEILEIPFLELVEGIQAKLKEKNGG